MVVPIVDPGGDLVRAIVDNYRGVLDLIEQFEGARVERARGCVRWTSAIRLPLFNGVLGAPTVGDLDAAVDDVLAPFDDGDVPLVWIVPPPALDLTEHLTTRGFAVGSSAGMAIDLSLLPRAAAPIDASIREVDNDPTALEVATRISLIANEFPADATPPWLDALARMPGRRRVRTFLATVNGEPAATSQVFETGGAAGLWSVGTVAEHRRRGLGRLVSTVAMHAGRDDGYRTGVLIASEMGELLYRAIGFEERCRFLYAVRESRETA